MRPTNDAPLDEARRYEFLLLRLLALFRFFDRVFGALLAICVLGLSVILVVLTVAEVSGRYQHLGSLAARKSRVMQDLVQFQARGSNTRSATKGAPSEPSSGNPAGDGDLRASRYREDQVTSEEYYWDQLGFLVMLEDLYTRCMVDGDPTGEARLRIAKIESYLDAATSAGIRALQNGESFGFMSGVHTDGGKAEPDLVSRAVGALLPVGSVRRMSSEHLLAITVVLTGIIGCLIASFRSTTPTYTRQIILGIATGFIAYLAMRGGKAVFLMETQGLPHPFNPYSAAFAGLLAGLFTERAYGLLNDFAEEFSGRLRAAMKGQVVTESERSSVQIEVRREVRPGQVMPEVTVDPEPKSVPSVVRTALSQLAAATEPQPKDPVPPPMGP